MALKNIFLAFLSVTMVAEVGLAQLRSFPQNQGQNQGSFGPGHRGDHGNHRGPGHGGWPGNGGNNGPGYPPAPPNYPPTNPGNGNQEQRTAILHRRIINERLQLLQLLQIGPQYRGYSVDSVVLNLRGSNAQISLLVNGIAQSTLINPAGSVRLALNYGSVLGREIGNLELEVCGLADIDSITMTLHLENNGNPGPGPVPGNIIVPIAVNQRMFSGGRLDISSFIDMNRYRGLRLMAMDINASAANTTAYLTTLVNGQSVGQALSLNVFANTYTIFPQNAILGQYADAVVFFANGDLNLNNVSLRLSR